VALEDEVKRGGDARQVLESTIFIEARKHVLDGIETQMRRVPMADQTMHTRLILALQCWDALEKYLEQIKQTGEIADFQLEQAERKRRFQIFG
jgi:hypothetical protein